MGRYAIFSANFLPNIGGIEKFTDSLAREMAREGHAITIVTNNVFDLAGHEELEPGLDIYRLPCRPCIGGRMPLPKRNAEFKRLWQELSARHYDGVLINARFYAHSLLGLRFADVQGVRAAVLDHGSAYLTFGSPVLDMVVKVYEHVVTGLAKRHSPAFYGVSSKSAEWLKTFGIEAEGVLSNAIDADAFAAQASSRDFRAECDAGDDGAMVAFVGRLIPEKGVPQLLEAMELVRARGGAQRCVIAGDGPLRAQVERAATGNPNLRFAGRLDAADIAALFSQADAVVLPSRSEGFATTLLEAAACGTPALSTDVGGAQEVGVGDIAGVLLQEADADEIAGAIEALSRTMDRTEKGALLQQRVRASYSWHETAGNVLKALRVPD